MDELELKAAEAVATGLNFERTVPIALIVAVLLQTGGALLWAGGAAERIAVLERRLDRQSGVTERLARLEMEAELNRASLVRIEAKLDRPLQAEPQP